MGYLVFLCGLPAVAPGEFYLAKHRTAAGLPMRHSLRLQAKTERPQPGSLVTSRIGNQASISFNWDLFSAGCILDPAE
jgi:hypothetical protein